MSVANHRRAAVTILAAGVILIVAWGRSQARETPEIRSVRDRFAGRWVATLVQAGENRKAEGPDAARCRIAFDGKAVNFRQMIGGDDSPGTYLVWPDGGGAAGKIDLKLDAGIAIGSYEVSDDRLALAINALALPERLAVPTRGRPLTVRGGEDRHFYVFRRAHPGE